MTEARVDSNFNFHQSAERELTTIEAFAEIDVAEVESPTNTVIHEHNNNHSESWGTKEKYDGKINR